MCYLCSRHGTLTSSTKPCQDLRAPRQRARRTLPPWSCVRKAILARLAEPPSVHAMFRVQAKIAPSLAKRHMITIHSATDRCRWPSESQISSRASLMLTSQTCSRHEATVVMGSTCSPSHRLASLHTTVRAHELFKPAAFLAHTRNNTRSSARTNARIRASINASGDKTLL